jgi:hypothetical protein
MREKRWCGEDHEIGQVFHTSGAVGSNGEHAIFRSRAAHAKHRLPRLNVWCQLCDQPPCDPAIPFRPGERPFVLRRARSEIMHARPCRRIARQCAVIVAAGVIEIPAQIGRIEAIAVEPIRHGDSIKIGRFRPARNRNGELARSPMFGHARLERPKLFAIFRRQPDVRFDLFLPSAMQKQPLLRLETEIALVPPAVSSSTPSSRNNSRTNSTPASGTGT